MNNRPQTASQQENQTRFLDAALGKWFCTLPSWLKFEVLTQDVNNSLLGSIGGKYDFLIDKYLYYITFY